MVLPVLTGTHERWAVVDAADLTVTGLDSLDLTRPLATLRADRVLVPAGRVLPGLTRTDVTTLAAALFAAEACGIAGWAVRTAADYATIRHQFGRPIGQFQAVKHRCARMLTAAEQAAAAARDAVAAQDAGMSPGWRAPGPQPGASSPPPWPRSWRSTPRSAAPTSASRSSAGSATPGSIRLTGTTGARCRCARCSARPRAGPDGSLSWPSTAPAGRSGSTCPRTPSRYAPRSGPSWPPSRRSSPPARTPRLAAGGWVVPHLPAPWGRAAGPLEQLVIAEEMKQAGLRAPALLIGAWVVPALASYGTPAQQDRFLPATLRGEITWCQLFSEPGAGLRPGRADHPGGAG